MLKPKYRTSRVNTGLLLAIAVFLQATALPGQAVPIAVLDFEANGISQTEAIALTDRLRNELFRLGQFEVVERGLMEDILLEQDFQLSGCTTNDCLVEVGRLIGARQVVGGRISKLGAMFTVSARVVDVETGKLLGVSDYDLRGGLEEMLTVGMKQVAIRLSTYKVEIHEEEQGRKKTAAAEPFSIIEKSVPQGKEIKEVTENEKTVPDTIETIADQIDIKQTEIRQHIQDATIDQKPRKWQSLFKGSSGDGNDDFILTLSYLISARIHLMSTELQPIIVVGFLDRSSTISDLRQYESTFYGMFEVHRQWNWVRGAAGASMHGGIGLGVGDYLETGNGGETSTGLSLIYSAGAQVNGKLLLLLPTLVADLRYIATPRYGSTVLLSIGVQGTFPEAVITSGLLYLFALLSSDPR